MSKLTWFASPNLIVFSISIHILPPLLFDGPAMEEHLHITTEKPIQNGHLGHRVTVPVIDGEVRVKYDTPTYQQKPNRNSDQRPEIQITFYDLSEIKKHTVLKSLINWPLSRRYFGS